MGFRYFSLLFVVLCVGVTCVHSRKIVRNPPQILPRPICSQNMAIPFPAVIETTDCGCQCQRPVCNDQLILPPLAVELPRGLGYMPSALPLVADYYEPAIEYLTTGAYLPIASRCNCLTLAAPVCPEIAPLVKPIIL